MTLYNELMDLARGMGLSGTIFLEDRFGRIEERFFIGRLWWE